MLCIFLNSLGLVIMNITQKTILAAVIGLVTTTGAQAERIIKKQGGDVASPVLADFPVGWVSQFTLSPRTAYSNTDLTQDRWFLETFTPLKPGRKNSCRDLIITSAFLDIKLKTQNTGAMWRYYTPVLKDAGDTIAQVSAGGFEHDFAGYSSTGLGHIAWSSGAKAIPLPLAFGTLLKAPAATTVVTYKISQEGLNVMNTTNRFSFAVIEDSAVVHAELTYFCE